MELRSRVPAAMQLEKMVSQAAGHPFSQLQALGGVLRLLRGKYAHARQFSLVAGGLGAEKGAKGNPAKNISCA